MVNIYAKTFVLLHNIIACTRHDHAGSLSVAIDITNVNLKFRARATVKIANQLFQQWFFVGIWAGVVSSVWPGY